MHAYESKLLELADRDPNVVIMTAETRFSMRNIPGILGDRFVDVGISEQNLIGIAAGLAKRGKFPICHALAAFLTMRPFEFIRTDLGYPNLKAVLVGSFNGFVSQANGPTHQAIEDIGLMRLIPNMSVVAPSDIEEQGRVFDALDALDGPLYVRYNDGPPHALAAKELSWGKNARVVSGERMAILSYGLVLNAVLDAVPLLQAGGIRPSVYNMRFLRPMDEALLDEILTGYGRVVVVEDHYALGGLLSVAKERAVDIGARAPIEGINLGDRFFKPALLEEAMEVAGFSPARLAERIAAGGEAGR